MTVARSEPVLIFLAMYAAKGFVRVLRSLFQPLHINRLITPTDDDRCLPPFEFIWQSKATRAFFLVPAGSRIKGIINAHEKEI